MERCSLSIWHGFDNRIQHIEDISLADALKLKEEYRKEAILYSGKHPRPDHVLYCVIEHDEELDIITHVHYFKNTLVTGDRLREYMGKMPYAEFGFLHAREQKSCESFLLEEKSKRIAPLTLREANAFVTAHHRHHDSVTGCKFAIGLYKTVDGEDRLIGAAICGRPVSRHLDDGLTLEVNRLCTTEGGNCCSMLYGRCVRIAREMGYRKVITYILESEPGTSLKASGFYLEDECCGGKNWNGTRKRVNNTVPEEMKQRWARILTA